MLRSGVGKGGALMIVGVNDEGFGESELLVSESKGEDQLYDDELYNICQQHFNYCCCDVKTGYSFRFYHFLA